MPISDWSFPDLVEALRGIGTFALFYLLLPWLASGRKGLGGPIQVAFILQGSILLLGMAGLALPGMVAFVYSAWLLYSIIRAYGVVRLDVSKQDAESFVLRIHQAFSGAGAWRDRLDAAAAWARPLLSGSQGLILLVMALTLAQRSQFALWNVRFAESDTYRRVISLHELMHGHKWVVDGWAPLHLPLIYWSGLDAAVMVRFAGPLFSTFAVAATAYCAWRWSGPIAGAWAAGLSSILPVLYRSAVSGETGPEEISAAFWLLAMGLWKQRRDLAVISAATAAMISPWPGEAMLVLLICAAAGWGAARLASAVPVGWRRPLTASALSAITLLSAFPLLNLRDGPHQFESAARVAMDISHRFPRNHWMVVSPTQEVAFTFGRGWHLEISEFVNRFTEEEVAPREFRFPYEVSQLFVFVEKSPLVRNSPAAALMHLGSGGLVHGVDPAVAVYGAPLGRASMQFKAARLMAAYLEYHDDLRIYYEDETLVVYQVISRMPLITDTRPATIRGSASSSSN